MKILTIIPARRDSKGIPGKNWKLLGGKPLIAHTIEAALEVSNPEDICISTNADNIIELAQTKYHLEIPFKRPETLSSDTSTSRDVKLHAIDFYEKELNKKYDAVLLLQPTSPFRKKEFIIDSISLFEKMKPEMVVSVFESNLNPYYNLYSKNELGFISRSIASNFTRRQDCPPVYAINGSIYVIDIQALRTKEVHDFTNVNMYEMPQNYSVDLDSESDWMLAEYLIEKNLL